MPPPHLHLFHPPEPAFPGIIQWLAEAESVLQSDADWDGCRRWRVPYDLQAGFDIATQIDRVRRNPGPAIFIQKVQAGLFTRFRTMMRREVSVYAILPACPSDIWQACEEASAAYDDGEPRIPIRELIAYLIVAKLARQDKWGGTSLNKNFLWADDLPKGGFPKEICVDREIMQVADALLNANVLTRKKSQGQTKYALGDRRIIQPILESRAFEIVPALRNYFDRSPRQVCARLLTYDQT